LWTLERFVAELDAVREALAPGPVHVLGHSWGSGLLIEWLVTIRPVNVESAIFAGPCLSVPRYNEDSKALIATLSPESQAAIAEAMRTGDYQSAAFQAAYNGEFMGRYVSRTPDWAALDAIQRTGAGVNTEIYTLMWGATDLECTGTLNTFDRTAELPSLTWPALFHAGEFDETRPETAREHAALTPDAEFVMIPNSGHLTMIDAPDAANRAIREFLRRVERA
jgi:proline iminopeptidase